MKRFFARKVMLFGRAIPLTTILAAVVVIGAAAWVSIFLYNTRFAVSTTTALLPPEAQGSWACAVASGSGATITTCAERTGSNGPELVVTGLSADNLFVQLYRTYHNPNPTTPYTVTIAGPQDPHLPVCVSDAGGICLPAGQTIAGNGTAIVYLAVRSAGIGPGEAIDLGALQMNWAP